MKNSLLFIVLFLVTINCIKAGDNIPYCITHSDAHEKGDWYIFDISKEKLKQTPAFNPFLAKKLPLKTEDIIKITPGLLPEFDAGKDEYRIASIILQKTNVENKWFYKIGFVHKKFFLRSRCICLYSNGKSVKYIKKTGTPTSIEDLNIIKPTFSKKWNLSIQSSVSGKKMLFCLSEKDFVDEVDWNPAKGEIPLQVKDATRIAVKELDKYTSFSNEFKLDTIEIKSSMSKDKWYFLFSFTRNNNYSSESLRIPVLFSGKAIDKSLLREEKFKEKTDPE